MEKDIIEQATKTLKNDLSKTQKQKVIEKMVEALNEHRIDDIGDFLKITLIGLETLVVEQK